MLLTIVADGRGVYRRMCTFCRKWPELHVAMRWIFGARDDESAIRSRAIHLVNFVAHLRVCTDRASGKHVLNDTSLNPDARARLQERA